MILVDTDTQQLIVSDLDPDALDLLAGLALSGPLLVIGPPGVGKSAMADDIAKKVANKLGVKEYILCRVPVPQISIVDLYVPVPLQEESGWVITHALSENLKRVFEKAKDGMPGVIVLDDITLAPAEMQPPMQAMTDVGGRVLGGHPIPPSLKIIATGNPEAWGAESLLASLRTRMAVVNYLPDPQRWAERFLSYWGKAGDLPPDYPPENLWKPWRQKVSAFIKAYPSFLYVTEPSKAEGLTPPSPRGWDLFSRALAWNNVPIDQPDEYDTIRLTGTAYLPAKIAESFAGFAIAGDMPSPEEIFANIPKFVEDAARGKFSSLFGVICARLGRYISSNITRMDVVESAISLAQKLQERHLNNLYAIYQACLTDTAREQKVRQLAAKNDAARRFIMSVGNMVNSQA